MATRSALPNLDPGDDPAAPSLMRRLHLDMPLLIGLLALCAFGLMVLYSASNQDLGTVKRQLVRLALAFGLMLALAQISPARLRSWSPSIYGIGVLMLFAVLLVGDVGKGAQRWLETYES